MNSNDCLQATFELLLLYVSGFEWLEISPVDHSWEREREREFKVLINKSLPLLLLILASRLKSSDEKLKFVNFKQKNTKKFFLQNLIQ